MTEPRPMLATVGTELPRGEGWVFEPKYDGIRILAFATPRTVRLLSRNGLDKTRQFPEVADALRALAKRARRPFVVDGEIVAMRGNSPARFQELQGRMHVTDRTAIAAHEQDAPAALMLFDMLVDGKHSLVTEPWRVRRKHLAALLQPPGRYNALRLSDVSENGAALLRTARANDWEGIIAKDADAPYEAGHRSRAWRKLKIEHRQEFVVGGWTEPRNSRQHIGAILLGYYDADGGLVYAGHTGTGFGRQSLSDMYQRLRRIERKSSPFTTTPRTNEHPHWTRPSIVVEIKFNEWTADGKLRQPVLVGVRDDKNPREVTHEPESLAGRPAGGSANGDGGASRTGGPPKAKKAGKRRRSSSPAGAKSSADVEAIVEQLEEIEERRGDGELALPTGALAVSNLEKVFFPDTGQTKGDLLRYYARISPVLLPAIADRPLVMKRYPNGVRGNAFY